jgi:hypothetical protein
MRLFPDWLIHDSRALRSWMLKPQDPYYIGQVISLCPGTQPPVFDFGPMITAYDGTTKVTTIQKWTTTTTTFIIRPWFDWSTIKGDWIFIP